MKPSTIIVGAGWAGLTCAIKLIQANHQVTLIDAAPQIGGRARTITIANNLLDNGQHVCIGAYTLMLKLLQSIGIAESTVFTRLPLQLKLYDNDNNIAITLPRVPSPLHTIIGLITAKGITTLEKLAIIKLFIALHKNKFNLAADCSILEALKNLNQPTSLITNLWEPLALAIMSTPINIASANVFFQVLKDGFTEKASNADWLLPKKDLSQILPIPAYKYLSDHEANIILQQSIKTLIYKDEHCVGVANDQNCWYADHVVLATPANITAKLLTNKNTNIINKPAKIIYDKTITIANNLAKITYNTITTIYLIFAGDVALPYQIIGSLEQPIQWFMLRKFSAQTNIISAIITHSEPKPTQYTNDELLAATITQLNRYIVKLPKLINTKIIHEKQAAFFCTPAIQQLRPENTTNITNLFLAGDYTKGNYPATLEGAVRSGMMCAELINNF